MDIRAYLWIFADPDITGPGLDNHEPAPHIKDQGSAANKIHAVSPRDKKRELRILSSNSLKYLVGHQGIEP